ncbi:survival protein SurA precursor (Peptidyl-prolyl cis-trans isomerase SurA) [Methylophaga lonarensis MPL]|uniref:Chaperone SurA n=1 Tax=Methylophaga lonarensis MPL TaxID=1286106 RepID=M7NXF7_9GAMM|nr:peptidylprolyl isomerase [Methylophaga lonarensis]EMR13473.1 survival protein SurA precursor (Peptidyl-prolyl cis-trans isomerase SurA) [Methylophaga lonarensis MPL]
MLKHILFTLLLISPAAMAMQLDRIVAVVDDEIILESELAEMEANVRQQLRQRGSSLPSPDMLRRQVLERLVMQKIQLQHADRIGIRVGEDGLNAALRQIADNNQMTLREFRDALEADGFSFAEFRESIREEMLIARLRKSEVEDRVIVSEREVDNFLATVARQEGNPETSYLVQHILISLPDAAEPEQVQAAQARLDQVLALLNDGADFAEVAAGYSDGQTALEGGSLGWRTEAEIPSLFVDHVTNMRVGQISEPIRAGSGFHLIRLEDQKSEETFLVRQTRASHILIQSNELLTDEDASARLEQLRNRIINGEDFAELARANSDDTGSAIDGGSLGWASPGVMVPEFEEVMDSLAPGELSHVFQSRFGWHLIKVHERREQNMADEYRRNQARETLRQRKIEEEMESWMRALRDEAYVEYRNL